MLKYRLFVATSGRELPVELLSCADPEDILVMVQSAITQGYHEFVVVRS